MVFAACQCNHLMAPLGECPDVSLGGSRLAAEARVEVIGDEQDAQSFLSLVPQGVR